MALDAKLFGDELKTYHFDFYSGVPCHFLKGLVNYAINNCIYIAAVNEGDAAAICAGAYLGGKKAVFLCQNSGLANAISPLVSLNYVFRIPVLGFVSLRGGEGCHDEPQHELMGRITTDMLDLLQIKWEYLSNEISEAKRQVARAKTFVENNQSFFFVVKKGTFGKEALRHQRAEAVINENKILKTKKDSLPKRAEILEVISKAKDDNTLLFATTGFTSRELYEIEDAKNNFYMIGSMGCVSSIVLGLALARKDKKIIAIDGDGALLMRMGALPANAHYHPVNMLHIVIDNNIYESTGGQATVSSTVNFVEIAAHCGYKVSIYAHNLSELKKYIDAWKHSNKLTFIYIKARRGTKRNLGRPGVAPVEVKRRIMEFMGK